MIKDSKQVLIYGSVFKNLASNSLTGGGAISIQETTSNKAYTNAFKIDSCIFEGCQSVNGGAISFLNTGGAQVKGNTIFSYNTAEQAGGAIYFNCDNYKQDFKMCSLDI